MNNKSVVCLVVLFAAIGGFLVGRWSKVTSDIKPERRVAAAPLPPAPFQKNSAPQVTREEVLARLQQGGDLTLEQARQLTRQEKLEAVRKGALIFEGGRQTEYLIGIIGSLTKEEIREAVDLLGAAQNRGNFCAQSVWDAIWKQWGRVDPLGVLQDFRRYPNGKFRSDARHVMEGWMESDPQAALAWARTPKENFHDAAAAAAALTRAAEGDSQKLMASLLALPSDSRTLKDAVHDYFDLASLSGQDTAAAYAALPAALQSVAWDSAMKRLTYTDPQQAVDWLVAHVNDAGRTSWEASFDLVDELARDDPAATVAWAARLPEKATDDFHPVDVAMSAWLRADPVAASAWIESQPDGTNWIARLRPKGRARNSSE